MREKSFGEFLANLRKKKRLTQIELADKIGVGHSTISYYEQNKVFPSVDVLAKIASVLDADFNELLEMEEEAKKVKRAKRSGVLPDIEAFTMGKDGKVTRTEISEFVTLPVLGQVHAGDPNFIPDNEIIDVIKLPRRIAHSADYALLIKGMSMVEEGINEGDIVLVKAQNDADNNQIVIARIEDEYTIKRLRKENGQVWLEPANSHYKKINPPFEIVGRIVYLIKRFS
jgi:SOS regulatory protein LexA